MPTRLASVLQVHPDQPELDAFAAVVEQSPGIVGLRAVLAYPPSGEEAARAEAGDWDPVFATCSNNGVPLFVFATRFLSIAERVADRYPDLTLIIDHIGLPQPPMDRRETPPFRALPEVLRLARYENVVLKLCGLPALSREQFPYLDVQPYLRQLIAEFGADRLMWASDIQRFNGRIGFELRIPGAEGAYEGKHTYSESLHFIRDNEDLTDTEKQLVLGGTLKRWLGWPPGSD
jgi:L-fuconolactonase